MKQIIYKESFLVPGIMCDVCGSNVENTLQLNEFKKNNHLPEDAKIIIDSEPEALGIHRILIFIESEQNKDVLPSETKNLLSNHMREQLDAVGYPVIEASAMDDHASNRINWLNIAINLLAVIAITSLSLLFPPSILLTIGLSTLSFLASTFTARSYIIQCVNNIRSKRIATMAGSITLGWFLSLSHTLYHSILMPLAHNFSMVFMSYIMPILLISIINGMDEIKSLVMKKSQKMHLKGMRSLFPQMNQEYLHYPLTAEQQQQLLSLKKQPEACQRLMSQIILDQESAQSSSKNLLKEGMLVKIKRDDCFPVDGFIVQGFTTVDNSLLNGELNQSKSPPDAVPAGAINLGEEVLIYTLADSYHSTLNQLLFKANRSSSQKKALSNQLFHKLYLALVVLSLIASVLMPFALGIVTLSMILQNVTGILFTVCPCTMAIADQLPHLLSTYNRGRKGIILRDESSGMCCDDMHTIVFDKTGTLTTGKGKVAIHQGISQSLWERIYLLEKNQGGKHPLAQSIIAFCEQHGLTDPLIKDIQEVKHDPQNRGLSAKIQGKKIHIGNLQYIEEELQMPMPLTPSFDVQTGLELGFTPIYIAEDKVFQGVILIQQEIRTDVLASLKRLKQEGKQLILLTGDTSLAAEKFNQQMGGIFDPDAILAAQKPADKESFLKQLMNSKSCKPSGVWFVGDGLNDSLCARLVSEQGGKSCSMTSQDKAAYFTDISLNGTLDYLFQHQKLNLFLKKNVQQNQWIIAFSTLSFLAFILVFSKVGIAVLPLIPLGIMVFTTLFTLFNSYRMKLAIDLVLGKQDSWFKQVLASDFSFVLLLGGSALLISGLLLSTLVTGGFALPALVFTTGAAVAISSSLILGASVLFGLFLALSAAYLITERCLSKQPSEAKKLIPSPLRFAPSIQSQGNEIVQTKHPFESKSIPLKQGDALQDTPSSSWTDSALSM